MLIDTEFLDKKEPSLISIVILISLATDPPFWAPWKVYIWRDSVYVSNPWALSPHSGLSAYIYSLPSST